MKVKLLLTILAALLGVNSTLASGTENSANPAVKFTDPSKAIIVNADEPKFSIHLRSNPTTGYSWVLSQYNQYLLEPTGHVFQASDTKMIGAPGEEIFEFELPTAAFTVPQKAEITFEYVRPWMTKVKWQKITFTIMTRQK